YCLNILPPLPLPRKDVPLERCGKNQVSLLKQLEVAGRFSRQLHDVLAPAEIREALLPLLEPLVHQFLEGSNVDSPTMVLLGPVAQQGELCTNRLAAPGWGCDQDIM